MVERDASDLHLTVGSPPVMRVNGRLERLPDYEKLTPEETRTLIYRIISTEQQKHLETQSARSTSRTPSPASRASASTPTSSARASAPRSA